VNKKDKRTNELTCVTYYIRFFFSHGNDIFVLRKKRVIEGEKLKGRDEGEIIKMKIPLYFANDCFYFLFTCVISIFYWCALILSSRALKSFLEGI